MGDLKGQQNKMVERKERNMISTDDEFKDCINSVKESLIYAMSKGSHELFHTNIWAWLIERDHSFGNVFFDDFKGDFVRVERETGNRDLTIWHKDKVRGVIHAYVVENKFKSVPRESQLDGYAYDLRGQFEKGVLVSLVKPHDIKNTKWNILTQAELMDRIEKRIVNSSDFNEFEKNIVFSYIDMTRKLSILLSYYLNSHGNVWPLNGVDQIMEDVKLWDISSKIKAAELVQYIESQPETKKWHEIARDRSLILSIRPGFSNKSALLDVRFEKFVRDDTGRNEEQFCIGIQIQGNQYRRCVCSHDVNKFKNIKSLYELFSTDCDWLNNQDFLGNNTRMRKEFCKYETKDYRFVYQYVILEDGDFKNIYERLKTDIIKAAEILSENSVIIHQFLN